MGPQPGAPTLCVEGDAGKGHPPPSRGGIDQDGCSGPAGRSQVVRALWRARLGYRGTPWLPPGAPRERSARFAWAGNPSLPSTAAPRRCRRPSGTGVLGRLRSSNRDVLQPAASSQPSTGYPVQTDVLRWSPTCPTNPSRGATGRLRTGSARTGVRHIDEIKDDQTLIDQIG